MMGEMVQNDSHDWFGDVAENLVRYVAARDGLEVYAAGKWHADVAVRRPASVGVAEWFRLEVRATDRPRRPTPKGVAKLTGKAEVVVEVTMPRPFEFRVVFFKLLNGRKLKGQRLENPGPGVLAGWL